MRQEPALFAAADDITWKAAALLRPIFLVALRSSELRGIETTARGERQVTPGYSRTPNGTPPTNNKLLVGHSNA